MPRCFAGGGRSGTAPGSDLPERFGLGQDFYFHYKENSKLLDGIFGFGGGTSTLRTDTRVERINMAFPTNDMYKTLGVRPMLGRLPVPLLVADLDEFSAEDLDRVRRLRAEFPRMEIIALVSLSTPAVRAAERQGVVRAVLEKPIALARLEGTVRSALARTTSP